MQKPREFCTKELAQHKGEFNKIRKRLRVISLTRLLVFVIMVMLLWLFWENAGTAITVFVVGTALFLYLVRFAVNEKAKERFARALIKVNETELKVLDRNYSDLSLGTEYMDATHPYGLDMDIFGQGSFFQYLNRTRLPEAQDRLAELMTSNNIEAIDAKQGSVDELAQDPKWRQAFSARASLVDQNIAVKEVVNWLDGYRSFVPPIMRFLPVIFLGGSLVLGILAYQYTWSANLLVFWMVLGLVITGRYYKQISQLSLKADRAKGLFGQYAQLLKTLEETNFKSPQLKSQQLRLLAGNQKASEAIAGFSGMLNTMDYNNNIFYVIFGNGCALGALWSARRIEGWIKKHRSSVGDWFQVVHFFEACNSLGNFAFNHPRFTYPLLTDGPGVLSCEKLGHPLIAEDKNVKNDFGIDDKDFHIITGSNMAGKSTFLRSVGLCVVMANMGLPVHAQKCSYRPIKLVTSMRSVDSLYKGDSYFLSELKRLKMVVELLGEGPYFVLLDEILKGTNSTDKANGSKRFLAKLIKANATGLIATHDLSLCDTAKDFQNVYNFHLDATIENGELHFDYLLKEGVSKTMNASFLLEKMDLV